MAKWRGHLTRTYNGNSLIHIHYLNKADYRSDSNGIWLLRERVFLTVFPWCFRVRINKPPSLVFATGEDYRNFQN